MKSLLIILALSITSVAFGQNKKTSISQPDPSKKIDTVEASCGLCQFDMKADECKLAVRMNGKTYFVEGTSIDDHGDAHASDGFCATIRKAAVQGELVNNRFKVTYFKLLPLKEEKKTD
ncbi:MAG TPA: DUF6370 family protein [Chitinophagaceae bacterium]|nr:DUF6370 family protein [Chitinophagaceae bacterium]